MCQKKLTTWVLCNEWLLVGKNIGHALGVYAISIGHILQKTMMWKPSCCAVQKTRVNFFNQSSWISQKLLRTDIWLLLATGSLKKKLRNLEIPDLLISPFYNCFISLSPGPGTGCLGWAWLGLAWASLVLGLLPPGHKPSNWCPTPQPKP